VGGLGQVTDALTEALLPKLKDLVTQAAEGAEPAIKRVVNEEVMPKLGLIAVLGIAAGAAVAAAVGSYYATRRNPPVRRRRYVA